MTSLRGRRAIVTGASSGIGRAIARSVAAGHGRVALLARRADRLDALAQEIGPDAIALPCDVADFDDVSAAVAKAAAAFGALDAVVANAGQALVGHIATGDPARWKQLLDVNLFGVLSTIRAALPHFDQTGPRDVVLVGSTAARTPHETAGVYAAAKRGVAAIADALRLELAPRVVRVCLVEPGDVATELRAQAVREEAPGAGRALSGTYRALTPEQIAEVVTFILSRPDTVAISNVVVRPTGELTP